MLRVFFKLFKSPVAISYDKKINSDTPGIIITQDVHFISLG